MREDGSLEEDAALSVLTIVQAVKEVVPAMAVLAQMMAMNLRRERFDKKDAARDLLALSERLLALVPALDQFGTLPNATEGKPEKES